jgi:hypothetical protein
MQVYFYKYTWLILAFFLLVSSCQKEKEPLEIKDPPAKDSVPTNTNPVVPPKEDEEPKFAFIALEYDQKKLQVGRTTEITAVATGTSLTYHWAVSAGEILGSGSKVTYAASICCDGENVLTCTVKDSKGNSATKTTIIYVGE